jgi:sugar lactone lactonase YvrE
MARVIALVVLGASVLGSIAAQAEPVKVWELTGLKAPESALPDPSGLVLYVSNIDGSPVEKDGKGAISKVSPDGKMVEPNWVTGLDAPKGMAISGGRLYVSDIDKLVEIDLASRKVSARHEAPGAKFLNDVEADRQGRIYVSDMFTDTIWRLENGRFEPWLQDQALLSPNGLYAQGDKLIVATWGIRKSDGFETSTAGHLIEVSLKDKSVRDLGSAPVGNLDGIELQGESYLVTDWMAGELYRITSDGKPERLLDLPQGSADLTYLQDQRIAVIPMMMDNKLVAYRIE